MSKETFYFSHDYNARNDPRLMRVKMKYGMEGIGVYWCIIEMLYEQNGFIPLINIESIAFELHTECERIKSILQDFDLFKFKDDKFCSTSVMRRLKTRNEKSEGARQSALKRWHPDKYKGANAMQTQCDSNAIKERKGKEKKGNKSMPDKPADFIDQIVDCFVQEHGSYEIVTPGKEREMAGKILSIYKKKYPDASSEETLNGLRQYFKMCVNISDQWLKNNMSLSTIVSKFNQINKILKNGTNKNSGATDEQLAGLLADKLGIEK